MIFDTKMKDSFRELLLAEKSRLLEKLKEVDEQLLKLSTPGTGVAETNRAVTTLSPVAQYPLRASWRERVLYVLAKIGPAPSRKIQTAVAELEPDTDINTVVKSVSAVLATHSKPGGLFTKVDGPKGFVYGLAPLVAEG